VLGIDQESYLPSLPIAPKRYENNIGRIVQLFNNSYNPMIRTLNSAADKLGESTILRGEDVPNFAYELFNNSALMPKPKTNLPYGGQPYVSAGDGDAQARVYFPKNEEQAKRNLNFAVANLKAYEQWEKHTKPAQEAQKKADLARLEAEAKIKADRELKAKKERVAREARLKAGLDLYNKVNGTRHMTWSQTILGLTKREQWCDQAEAVAKLNRESNPWNGITAGQIQAASIRTTDLFASGGYRLGSF
jgi:hypothetical protein